MLSSEVCEPSLPTIDERAGSGPAGGPRAGPAGFDLPLAQLPQAGESAAAGMHAYTGLSQQHHRGRDSRSAPPPLQPSLMHVQPQVLQQLAPPPLPARKQRPFAALSDHIVQASADSALRQLESLQMAQAMRAHEARLGLPPWAALTAQPPRL